MKPPKLLVRLQSSQTNVRFGDFTRLLDALGFRLIRHDGSSHCIYGHPNVPEQVNIQNYKGQVKPYQVKQVLRLIDAYNLRIDRP